MGIISTKEARDLLKSTGDVLKNSTSDLLASSDFISRTIGMNNSYEDIMLLVQALGRQPVSLLGKDYLFIFDHVRRNYQQGTTVKSTMYGGGDYWCPKFTFYKEKPTVRFADPYFDNMNLLDRWKANFTPNTTLSETVNKFYAESNDEGTNNKTISMADSNMGTATGQYSTSFQNLASCDLIKKTNDNFNAGKYNTLVARFHTNNMESRDPENPTQTAISKGYGMSHGRNLLKLTPDEPNGYNNPYCRVWTYHHQYHRMLDAIRPFENANSAEELESLEQSGDYETVGFRTTYSRHSKTAGGSRRLDDHGVLNYDNGFVNIAPTAKVKDYFDHKADDKHRKSVSTKKCMFSIENLAWRDKKTKYDEFEAYGLSPEQKGPLGGRIMWFPPYDITFSENVSVKWNANEFIGRGEHIYTYTNTERRGNLSFTLLIDHPSILDYWTGHEKNGMKNQGVDLLPGNTGGVDEKNNQEQTLLRFFAGCDILSAKPQEYWKRDKTPETTPEDPPVIASPTPTPPEVAKPVRKQLCCVLYYPNNYSGKDDQPAGKNRYVNAVHYLMNGIGAQKCVNSTGYLEDIPTDIASKIGGDGNGYGGYEVITGISITTKPLKMNKEVRQSTYVDRVTSAKKAQYLTGEDGGSGYVVNTNGQNYVLGKIIGTGSKRAPLLPYSEVLKKLWHRLRWYYRVDEDQENDALTNDVSYIDTTCHHLNGSGYTLPRTTAGSFTVPEEGGDNNFHLISFTSMFNALEGTKNKVIVGDNCGVKNSDVDIVKKIIDKKNKIVIKEITYKGHASIAGDVTGNIQLAKNRAQTLKQWMESCGFPKKDDGTDAVVTYSLKEKKDHIDNGDANSALAKIWRSASVIIEYEESEVENASKIDSAAQNDENGKPTNNKVDTVQSKQMKAVTDFLYNTEEGRRILNIGKPTPITVRRADGSIVNIMENVPVNTTAPTGITSDSASTATTNTGKTDVAGVTKSTVKRYDNEGEFFELLDKKSPFLHHLITDKIKYFDPAYHSISPEGFNARLTFLHQCTRQGATIGNSDPDVQTAYNLAFGRPPICVLRIGDFYYTKIVINSMTINYDSPQWDLNPEGIGVMPMFAKINLDFTFIGGSDLAGPIARLQNAVSFNYYANASVYDNRAERVEYDPTGSGKEIKYKPFNFPNGTGRHTGGIVNDVTGEFRSIDSEGDWEDS